MEWLRRVDENPLTERVIMALIILNAVTLGLETSGSAMERYGPLLIAIDRIAIAIFVMEILARLIVQRASFFRDGWNIFDMVVVGVAVAPATAAFSVLRALRVLRLLRLITVVPALQRVVGGLIRALPGMGSILLLIGLVFYVAAVMAVNLYGADYPEQFGTLGRSLFTLFTVMTLEGWVDDVVKPILVKHPYAWVFFISFIVVTTFTVLNLIIGIIVNAIGEEHAASESAERKAERELIEEETADARAEGAQGRDRGAAPRGRGARQAPLLAGRKQNSEVMAGPDPAIHVFARRQENSWMLGTSPGADARDKPGRDGSNPG